MTLSEDLKSALQEIASWGEERGGHWCRERARNALTIVENDYQPAKNPSGNLCSESVAIDGDGFIIWEGGDRPVDGETVVAVKVRGRIPRSPIAAKHWPQITWRHREADDPMNKWDIVAYKVVG